MKPASGIWIAAPWLIFMAYWLIAGLRTNQTARQEPVSERLARLIVMIIAFLLLYEKESVLGLLNRRFVPPADWIFALGSALSFLGVGFAIWARYHIGKYWSSTVSLREGHELIRTGPYARIRHPIYTGMLLAVFGTALAVGRYRALFAFVIVLLGFIWKSKREEALLAGQFGAKFEEHRRHTGFFLPKFS